MLLSVDVDRHRPEFPGTPTGTVRFQKDGRTRAPGDADGTVTHELRHGGSGGTLTRITSSRAVYSGDGDYAARRDTAAPGPQAAARSGHGPGKVTVTAAWGASPQKVRCA